MNKNLNYIVAMSNNGVIGHDNKLLWNYSEDMKFFKTITQGHSIIMGRKTYESIGRPLPNRTNIILTQDPGFKASGCVVVTSTQEALEEAYKVDQEPFVIGGGAVYELYKHLATKIFLTLIDKPYNGDIKFQKSWLDEDWTCVKKTQSLNTETPELWFLEYIRKMENKK